jgi:phosphatidylserine decarboxylase
MLFPFRATRYSLRLGTMKKPSAFRESLPITILLVVPIVFLLLWWWPLAFVFVLLLAYNFYFFRDPERVIDSATNSIVAAADGEVVEIKRVREDHFCKTETQMVAIFLSVFDVHVQRAPIAGEIEFAQHFSGKFFDARKPEAALQNEHRVIGIRDGEFKVAVRQIAGLIARRIVGWRGAGERVTKGERIGMIRYGSRVEMYLPLDVELRVGVGQRVRGGETIIGYRK